ncbi:MAG: hypothetical protein QFX35_03865 [Candidatus Verstraetearchaeota archaeon]|nr:hypothetical protein [Candidatus Verstraetearchaeota archaeon]
MLLQDERRLGSVMILGGGKYGTTAVKRLRGKAERVLVVDVDPDCQARGYADRTISSFEEPPAGVSFVLADGASFLASAIDRGTPPDFVVLTIPKNVMAALFISWAESFGMRVEFDVESMLKAAAGLPGRYLVARDTIFGVLVASYARDHTCLDGCMQPEVCPVSGERRGLSMLEIVKATAVGDYVRIFESKLLERDVGGVEGREILEAYKDFCSSLRQGMRMVIGTACRCHAIVNFMSIA